MSNFHTKVICPLYPVKFHYSTSLNVTNSNISNPWWWLWLYHWKLHSELLNAHALFFVIYFVISGPGRVVGIATAYGLDGPGIESRWWRDFLHLSRPALRPTQPPLQWILGLSRGQGAAGAWRITPHPLLVPRSKIEQSYNSILPKCLRGL